jgi:hypothetical protein
MESLLKRNRTEALLASLDVNCAPRSEGCRHFAPIAHTANVNVTSAPLAGTAATVKVTSLPMMHERGGPALALTFRYGDNDRTSRTLGVLLSDGTFVGQADEGHPYVVVEGRHCFFPVAGGVYTAPPRLLDKVAALGRAPGILDIAPPTPPKWTPPFNPQGLPTSVIYAVRTNAPDPSRSLMFRLTTGGAPATPDHAAASAHRSTTPRTAPTTSAGRSTPAVLLHTPARRTPLAKSLTPAASPIAVSAT